VLGEYLSVPQAVLSPYPSRIAVDSKGNAWVANYSHDSIVKIGDPANGFWVDRNGNGKADTSGELGSVFAWTGSEVAGAADEAILLYVRTDLTGVRQWPHRRATPHPAVDRTGRQWRIHRRRWEDVFHQ
jgi:hypothetical protein